MRRKANLFDKHCSTIKLNNTLNFVDNNDTKKRIKVNIVKSQKCFGESILVEYFHVPQVTQEVYRTHIKLILSFIFLFL